MLDVPPKLVARVRLLATGDTSKNDPNDARSVAVAALRSAEVREARREDHAAVLKVWAKRYRDLGRARTQVACRLHPVLCELIPGGFSGEITAGQAALDQRIAVRYTMPGMTPEETASYIHHHLTLAGRSGPLFSNDAITLIHEAARGLPRAVNNIAVQALVAAYAGRKAKPSWTRPAPASPSPRSRQTDHTPPASTPWCLSPSSPPMTPPSSNSASADR